MIQPITKFGNPVLRTQCAPITKFDQDTKNLCQDLIETMRAARGVGLAAPQIGVALQACVVDCRGAKYPSSIELLGETLKARAVNLTNGTVTGQYLEGDGVGLMMPMILINPVIELSGDVYAAQEGCLSSNDGAFLKVPRSRIVKVKALDRNGEPMEFIAKNFLARAIQHEVDHLSGVLYIDKALPTTKK